MEHSMLVFTSLAAAQAALAEANRKWEPENWDGDSAPEGEVIPVLPEDPDNPGTIPTAESDPNWKGDWAVWEVDGVFAVRNDTLEWEYIG